MIFRFLTILPIILLLPATGTTKNFLKPHGHKKSHGKSHSYLQIEIQNQGIENGRLHLKAVLHPQKTMENMTVLWKFPNHIKMSQGLQNSTINIEEGKTQTIETYFEAANIKEGDRFFLFVTKQIAGENYGASQICGTQMRSHVRRADCWFRFDSRYV